MIETNFLNLEPLSLFHQPRSSLAPPIPFPGKRNLFWGRAPEEIKFKSGDIVEILGNPGNPYWSHDEVNLAIIVKTPPTIDEVARMRQEYTDTHSGFDLCDHALSTEFNYQMDTYEVLSLACDELDHAPTISVFKPTKNVSANKKRR